MPSPEQRAIDYLAKEVPRWSRENHCFSCHNNGDAARALYLARGLSFEVPAAALDDTTTWLVHPAAWDDPKGEPGFSDLKLARIQFAAALAEAVETGAVSDRQALAAAAERVLADQEADGSWDIDVPGVLGSPATYGDVLGTYMARRVLAATHDERFSAAMERAETWLLNRKAAATVDMSAVALGLAARLGGDRQVTGPNDPPTAAPLRLGETIRWILDTEASDGGWGPYPKSPSEAFDTAVALLALEAALQAGSLPGGQQALAPDSIETAISRGRQYLVAAQLPAGGWPATTRPSGFQSYAQHISTTGWAAQALLQTRGSLY